MRQCQVFDDVGVSYLSVICRYLLSMQVVKHQVPFRFCELTLYLGLHTIALCISVLNCIFLMGHMLNKCCYAQACFSLH